jgi:long-chain acyl-CoA synthetase
MSVERILDAIAARAPSAPVLIGDTQSFSASALLGAVEELARRLGGCRTLAVLADNGPAWVVADLAASRAGVTHVPLPTFFSSSQLEHVLNETGADTVLTDQPERIAALGLGLGTAGQWNGLAWMQRAPAARTIPAGTAKVSFTSGSTGNPKGVCLSAAGLVDTATAVATRLADLPIGRHLATLPLTLLLENTAGVYAPLLRGAEIHLPGLRTLGWNGMAGFDPGALQTVADSIRPSSTILVPELLKAWTLQLAATGQKAPSGLAYVAVGGARVDAGALRRARALGLPAYQGYGLTECGSVVSLNRPGDDGDDVGRPLDPVGARVEDGEILISARAFLGYLGGAGAAPRVAGTRDFPTGDLGQLDAHGHLHLYGRRRNLLITSYGRNVAPEWVEASLLAQPAIAQAVVAGEARPWLSAVLVPAPGVAREGLAVAIARVNAALPEYARIGDWITAAPFTLENGEATGNGRPVRQAILARYAAPLEALYSTRYPAHALL